ncbi:MAG: DHA2 family efflux MFS transporter permease subunit [Acidimicrobiales bacterium]
MSVVYVAALFMSIMDITIVNVALPTLGRDLRVQQASVESVAIAYLVSLAVFIPASGWLGDRFGGRKVLLTAVVLFTGASALCGLAQSLSQLVVFRAVQGIGGGMMAPVGMAMLFRTFPPAERVRAASIILIPTTFAPALGPVLGGLLVTDLSWRWVVFVNLPIGVIALAFGLVFLADHLPGEAGSFDLPGFLLAGAGLGLLMYGVSEAPVKGWSVPQIPVTIAVGAGLLALFVAHELRRGDPMIDFRLLGDHLFRSATGSMIMAATAFLGGLYLVALFYQDGLGLSALQSGLSTFPEALGVMSGAQLASRFFYPSFGPRRLMSAGLAVVAAALASVGLVGSHTSLWVPRGLMLVLGLGMAQVFVPAQAAAFATISSASTGRASALYNAGRQLGGAIGVAVLTTVATTVGSIHHPSSGPVSLRPFHVAFLAAALIALAGMAIATTVRDEDAAATIVARHRRARDAEMEPAVPA